MEPAFSARHCSAGLLSRETPSQMTITVVDDSRPRETDCTEGTVLVFPGQSNWTEAAVKLLESSPAFAHQMALCEAALAEFVDWSLLGVLRGSADSPNPERVDVAQPTQFAVMASMAAHWRALGIQPDAVLGHSEGEVAAAYVAGGVSLREAAKIVALRSRAARAIAGTGGLVAVARGVDRVHSLIRPWDRSISVAAQNGPSSTLVAGSSAALEGLVAQCDRDGVPARRLPIDYASHSSDTEILREPLREILSGLRPRSSELVFVSTVTGARLDTSILDGDYWFANLRQPVLFEQAVRWCYEHGYRTFVEASPHPVLNEAIGGVIDEFGVVHGVAPVRNPM